MTHTPPTREPTVPPPVRRFVELSSSDTRYAGGTGAKVGQLTRAAFVIAAAEQLMLFEAARR